MKREMIQQVQPVHIADFSEVIGEQHLIAASVGADQSPVILSLRQTPDYRKVKAGGGSFAKKQATVPNQFSIHYLVGEDWFRVDLQETHENFNAVQPLGREQWLLVRGRADGEADRNATIFDMEGHPRHSFYGGDGIEDVQATEHEKIWFSYFDEGVFGDSSFGKAGLVCLDRQGKALYEYNNAGCVEGLPYIADCYAFNACSDKEVWLCYYTDFPLVRLVDFHSDALWREIPVRGSHSFAVGNDQVLFCGSYEKRDSLFLLNLEGMSVQEITILDKSGQSLKDFRGIGRRSVLHISTADALYRLDVDDL
jgi:hypothetical protein